MIVKSQRAKKAILASLADEEMVKILDSLMFHSKSINDIYKRNQYCLYYMLSKDQLATERGTSKSR